MSPAPQNSARAFRGLWDGKCQCGNGTGVHLCHLWLSGEPLGSLGSQPTPWLALPGSHPRLVLPLPLSGQRFQGLLVGWRGLGRGKGRLLLAWLNGLIIGGTDLRASLASPPTAQRGVGHASCPAPKVGFVFSLGFRC